MVKLSDGLRGAADSAPLDGVAIDGPRTARRVARTRTLRGGANALVGAGAVALVAIGIIGPGSALAPVTDGASLATAESADGGGARDGADSGLASGTSLAWGLCGTELGAQIALAGPVVLDAAIPTGEAAGGTVDVTATTTAVEDGVFETFGIDGVVLWDGIVVATLGGAADDEPAAEVQQVTLSAGTETVTALTVPLANCWDGAELPAGAYELVLTQEFWPLATVEEPPLPPAGEPGVEEPGVEEPAVEPGVEEPAGAPTAGPVDAPSEGAEPGAAGQGDASSEMGVADGAAGSAAGGGVAAGGSVRVVSAPVGFVIPGEPVEEPFAAYLEPAVDPGPQPGEPPALPDSALTADTARALFAEGLAGPWDMAPGTQRWLMVADAASDGEPGWFGCGAPGFPERSAELDLLDVRVDAPAAISVSYGWIVDGNPEVRTTVTNTSSWDLTQFYGATSTVLHLARDGQLVAEAYPVDPDQFSTAIAEDLAAAGDAEGLTIAPEANGFLGAGATVTNALLWRDVTGCWTETGSTAVAPGTYTLLAAHQLSVPGSSTSLPGAGPDDMTVLEGEAGGASDGAVPRTDAIEPERMIAPAPEAYDWIELQAWTSLGTVTVR